MSAPAEGPWPEATELAERLVGDGGGSVRAVVLYGSRLHRANPDRHSALDFIVVVSDYRRFYASLDHVGGLHRPVGLMTRLAGLLAPNVIAYAPGDGREGIAKCLIVSGEHLERALGPEPPDHFLLGRMIQRLGFLWIADEETGAWLRASIDDAHRHVLDWAAPYLEGPFDPEGLGRRLLEVCYRGEFRPESRDRAGRVFDAQSDHFREVLTPVLRAVEAEGVLRREGERYALAAPVDVAVARRWKRYFRRSKARTTARWLKHVLTFANWLPYVVRKAERHTGRTIELTLLERKLPIVFLWPRVIWVLVTRPRREIES